MMRGIGLTSAIGSTSALAWASIQAGAAWRVLVLTVLPIGQTVDFDYDALSIWYGRLALVALIALTVGAIRSWHRARAVACGACWIAIVIMPRLIAQTPKSYFNEHQFYLALVGVALMASAALSVSPQKETI